MARAARALASIAVILWSIGSAAEAVEPGRDAPLLVVLTDTGQRQDGLPVLQPAPDPGPIEAVLRRGFSGRLLRIYRLHQERLSRISGRPVEPAYLLLSSVQGGFPRFGFRLGTEVKRDAGYVDLYRTSAVAGRPGAIDQIFPHELLHVIVRQLAGESRDGGTNQVHAVGVRTDPETAFGEGFAEHAQVMAAEDPDADPSTRALAADRGLEDWCFRRYDEYARALSARVSIAPASRMTFPLWFSTAEQVLRLHGVERNLFAFERPVAAHLLSAADPYRAYLLENVVPGREGDPRKEVRRALATEGVVSALFVRWVRDEQLERSDPRVESEFALDPDPSRTSPLDRAYLKLLLAIASGRPATTEELISSYERSFPGESAAVDSVLVEVLGPRAPAELASPAPELWLATPGLLTGTSVFDQFRGSPRMHTFDLNSSSVVDLAAAGIHGEQARRVLAGRPYRTIEDVRSAGEDSYRALLPLRREMEKLESRTDEEGLSLRDILLPFLWRALEILAAAAVLGTVLYRAIRGPGWLRAAAAGLIAALLGLIAGWAFGSGREWAAWVAPVVVLGVPSAGWTALRHGGRREALRRLGAWSAASLPAFVIVRPWF